MTLKELINTLESRKKGMAYFLWKNGMLNQWLSDYPDTPEIASPELYPPAPSIKKPKCLYSSELKRNGDVIYYE